MKRHLDEKQLTGILMGEVMPTPIQDHIESCLSCRRKLDGLRNAVEAVRRDQESEMPDWDLQRQIILEGLENRQATNGTGELHRLRRLRRFILPLAAGVFLALGGITLRQARVSPAVPTPRPALPIEEILTQADALLSDDSIPGFEGLDSLNNETVESILAAENS